MGDKIKYKNGFKYQLFETYSVNVGIFPEKMIHCDYIRLTKSGLLIIRKGYAWDGPSGPTYDSTDSMRGSLVHDALYQLMRLGLLPESSRAKADKILHDICTEDGMIPVRADLWEEAVKLFAAGAARTGTESPVLVAP